MSDFKDLFKNIKEGSVLVVDGEQDGVIFNNGICINAMTRTLKGSLALELTDIGVRADHFRLHSCDRSLSNDRGWFVRASCVSSIISCSAIGNMVKLSTGEVLAVTPSGYFNVNTLKEHDVFGIEEVEEIYCRNFKTKKFNSFFSKQGLSFVATKSLIDEIISCKTEISPNFFAKLQEYEKATITYEDDALMLDVF